MSEAGCILTGIMIYSGDQKLQILLLDIFDEKTVRHFYPSFRTTNV